MRRSNAGRVRFENPPVAEAVCEFRFEQIRVHSALIPGRYYERVKDAYSGIEMRRGVGLQAGGQELTMATEERTVFRNPAANRLVQIGPGMLAISQLRPYPGYVTFRQEIQARLLDYKAVASPKGLTRIGLRYINRFTEPEDHALEAILHVGFKVPQALGAKADPYLVRLEFSYQADRDRLILIVAKAADQPEEPGVMLDLDYVLVKPDQIEEGELMAWVDTAHETIEDVFHMCVTGTALASFRPIHSEREDP